MTQEDHAKEELRSCCQTLCQSDIVKDYIKTLEHEIIELNKKIKQLEETKNNV